MPNTQVDERYSTPDAAATPWSEARARLEGAEVYWLTTVRPGGRPHVTPLIAVWVDEALWFCTGPEERKARNLAANTGCVLTTGENALGAGLDVVVEGEAERERDNGTLRRVAEEFEAKYGGDWHFDVGDGLFHDAARKALVFRVRPVTAFGFRKGDSFAQTRYRF
jgi:hypothetical protein